MKLFSSALSIIFFITAVGCGESTMISNQDSLKTFQPQTNADGSIQINFNEPFTSIAEADAVSDRAVEALLSSMNVGTGNSIHNLCSRDSTFDTSNPGYTDYCTTYTCVVVIRSCKRVYHDMPNP